MHGVANEQRPNGASRTDVLEQQGGEARHWGEKRRKVREGTEGTEGTEGSKRRARGRIDCGDVRDGPVSKGDGDTRERKRRKLEAVTETRQKRLRENGQEKEDRKVARQRRHRRMQTLMISRRGLRECCLMEWIS